MTPPTLWAAIKEAVRGAHRHDYTVGPIGHSLLLLAVPMVLEVALESVFAVVNVFWVGRLGADAVATVGLTEALFSLIYALGMGLGIGATAMVARRIGEKNPEGAARAAVQAIALGALFAVPLGIAGGVFAPDLLRLMGASPTVVETGQGFTRVLFAGNGIVLLLFLINAIFRGAGDATIAMRSLWIANVCNMILDPLLIFGIGPFPELGVTGAAVATTIGRGMGVVYQFYRLSERHNRFVIRRPHLRLEPEILRTMLRLSGTGIFQIMITTTSWVGLVRVVSSFGSQALAGYTVAIRLVMFALLPAWGMANAAATMVGQALGAAKPDRAEKAVWLAGRYNAVFLGAVGLFFLVGAPTLVGLFTADPEVRRVGILGLRLVSAGFPFYAYGMVLTSSFNGAGDTWTPTLLNFFCFWLWEIPLAWFLAKHLDWGPSGVSLSIAVAFSTLAVASAVVFKRGRWKTRRL
ncbi:MAG: MATE family efflux transporter [Gemmatimonadales bacterium]|nr:MATE family efflux transporter [Gemmatimonadales bacterium]